jgi:membrane-associated phospholipid phosphatase
MTGVICFPSFHTTMALASIYAFRRTGIIGICVAGINSAMLFAIPFVGGHYLVDMIAGAGVALVSIAAVAWCPFIWKGLAATVRRARPAVPATAR